MVVQEQIERLWANLLKLGSRRLIALGVIGVSVFAMTGLAGYFLSRPARSPSMPVSTGRMSAESPRRSRKPTFPST